MKNDMPENLMHVAELAATAVEKIIEAFSPSED